MDSRLPNERSRSRFHLHLVVTQPPVSVLSPPSFYLSCVKAESQSCSSTKKNLVLNLNRSKNEFINAMAIKQDSPFTDLTLQFSDEIQRVHKVALYEYSGWFRAALTSEFQVCTHSSDTLTEPPSMLLNPLSMLMRVLV